LAHKDTSGLISCQGVLPIRVQKVSRPKAVKRMMVQDPKRQGFDESRSGNLFWLRDRKQIRCPRSTSLSLWQPRRWRVSSGHVVISAMMSSSVGDVKTLSTQFFLDISDLMALYHGANFYFSW